MIHFFSPARALALIAIKSNYPESPPLFSIEVDWKGRHSGGDFGAIRVSRIENIWIVW